MLNDHELLKRTTEKLTETLAQVPAISDIAVVQSDGSDRGVDLIAHFRSDQVPFSFAVEVKADGQPRHIENAVRGLHYYLQRAEAAYPVVVAPYLSERSRDICRAADVGFFDLEGNCRLVFGSVYIERSVPSKPKVVRRDNGGLYKPKAMRVLRSLLRDPAKRWKVKELSDDARVSFGQVSNVSSALVDKGWARRDDAGLSLADPDGLLKDWAGNYQRPGEAMQFYTHLHGDALTDAFRRIHGAPHITAGSASAARWMAPFLRTPMEYFYADAASLPYLTESLALVPKSRGGNVEVRIVDDEGVFLDSIEPAPGIRATGVVQTYLDLNALGDRGQEAADFLARNRLPWSIQG